MYSIYKDFITTRLHLRPWSRNDVIDLFEYASQPEVGPMAGWLPHRSKTDSITLLENAFLDNPLAWAMVFRTTGKVIGSINLRQDEKRTAARCYTLGYSMSKDYWGQGLMPEAAAYIINFAFTELRARILSCYHYPDNLRSKRVIEKCGFRYEGTLRQCAEFGDGHIYDECCYSMTKSEYEKARL